MEPGGHVPPIVLGCVGGSFPTHSLGSTGGQAGLLLHQLGEVRGLRGWEQGVEWEFIAYT